MSRVKLVHYRRFFRGPDFSTSAVFSRAASDARTITSRVTSCFFKSDQDEGRSSPSRLHGGLHRRLRYVYHWTLAARDGRWYRRRRRSDSGASPMAIEQRARTKDRHRPSAWTTTKDEGWKWTRPLGLNALLKWLLVFPAVLGWRCMRWRKRRRPRVSFWGSSDNAPSQLFSALDVFSPRPRTEGCMM